MKTWLQRIRGAIIIPNYIVAFGSLGFVGGTPASRNQALLTAEDVSDKEQLELDPDVTLSDQRQIH